MALHVPSILNDVIGPVMRGPSSSHTAGSYHIARLARALLGGPPTRARCVFDPAGSYGQVYRQQGVDRAFALGFVGWPLTDPRFRDALAAVAAHGLDLRFAVEPLPAADHPNTVAIELVDAAGARISLVARSVGGGAVEIVELDGWPVLLRGERHQLLVEVREDAAAAVERWLAADAEAPEPPDRTTRDGRTILSAGRREPLPSGTLAALTALDGVERVREVAPVAYGKKGKGLFSSATEMVALAEARGLSLGRLALAYESELLAIPEPALLAEMVGRFEIMRAAVHEGLGDQASALQLLTPSAGTILRAEAEGRVALGGLHTRAAARAMAVMHVNGSMGVVCAAPTGGSAGVLPGVLVSLVEERGLPVEAAALGLFAASAVGVIVAIRATFAAEVAGCQVEIGAAGAMAAAAVVDCAGGQARQGADAAAIALQNSMGSVCDLVQGMVEIPCHTRNAAAAASAFVCADLVMGGYANPIPLDETIDAVLAVGRMMPSALRCTARGGLAATPAAMNLRRLGD